MYCLSISHRKADVSMRSLFAFDCTAQKNILLELKKNNVNESVIVCTCNRTELYFTGENCVTALNVLAEYSRADKKMLSEFLMIYSGKNAVIHLFRVACGMDSMVIGEDEILGQVRNSYNNAFLLGTAGHELNMTFQSALNCAKKIKTGRYISGKSVSIAVLTANETAKFKDNVNVMLVGASGQIGSAVLKNLVSHKNVKVCAVYRHHARNIDNVKAIGYNERYSYTDSADCIISATSCPHYTFTYERLMKSLKTRKPRLLIDLAVPPDIDSEICSAEGIKVLNIDHFRKIAEDNGSSKLQGLSVAEEIIISESERLLKELAFGEFISCSENVRKNTENVSAEKILFRMKSEMTSDNFRAVLEFFKKNYGGE